MKIYTKTGDEGETGLFGGPRIRKDHARIAAYGEIDELNAALGMARAASCPPAIDEALGRVQNDLFALGAELATPDPAKHGTALLSADDVRHLETTIDGCEVDLPPLKEFILPGGSPTAAALHLARCICRRAERAIVTLASQESLRSEPLIYVNRLSDLLFVLARTANYSSGVGEVAWRRGGSG